MEAKRNALAKYAFIHPVLAAGGIVMVAPFLWMILTSMKSFGESVQVPPVLLPEVWYYENYLKLFSKYHFDRYYWNTAVVSVLKTSGQLLVCSIAAYAFAKMRFPWKNVLFLIVLTSLMLPNQVTLIPSFILIRELGWTNSYAALIVPGIFSAFGTFLLRQFFLTIPNDLDDAAKIDGCSYFGIFVRIYLYLSKPPLVTLTIFTMIASWNEFLWPLVVIDSDKMRVISIALASLVGQYMTDYPLLMAGGVVSTIPMLVMFIFFQRYFIEGITLSGIKG